jgi:proteasome lid subunit RPN8/RPN11
MTALERNELALGTSRMSGRIRPVELPLLGVRPEIADYCEHLTPDGRRAYIHKQVLRDLADLERREHPLETAGLLFGGYFIDGQDICTMVTKLVQPLPGEVVGTHSEVTITAAGAEQMTRRARHEDQTLTTVGWAHTHPRFEAYFSGVDRNEQRAWQHQGAVGLVLSGLRDARPIYRVFVGPDSTAARRSAPRVAARELPAASPQARAAEHRETQLPAAPEVVPAHGRHVRSEDAIAAVLSAFTAARRRFSPHSGRVPDRRARWAGASGRHSRDVRQAGREGAPLRLAPWLALAVLAASLAIAVHAMNVAGEARRQAQDANRIAARLLAPVAPAAGRSISEAFQVLPRAELWRAK